MNHPTGKGHVEFREPAVRLAAELPGDETMREHLKEWQERDGYEGSCGIARAAEDESEEV
jgi:hypothetical protein